MRNYGRTYDRRKPRRDDVRREVWEVQHRRLALGKKAKSEKRLEIYGGMSTGSWMKTYLHGPLDFAKTLKLRSRVGHLDLP